MLAGYGRFDAYYSRDRKYIFTVPDAVQKHLKKLLLTLEFQLRMCYGNYVSLCPFCCGETEVKPLQKSSLPACITLP